MEMSWHHPSVMTKTIDDDYYEDEASLEEEDEIASQDDEMKGLYRSFSDLHDDDKASEEHKADQSRPFGFVGMLTRALDAEQTE